MQGNRQFQPAGSEFKGTEVFQVKKNRASVCFVCF